MFGLLLNYIYVTTSHGGVNYDRGVGYIIETEDMDDIDKTFENRYCWISIRNWCYYHSDWYNQMVNNSDRNQIRDEKDKLNWYTLVTSFVIEPYLIFSGYCRQSKPQGLEPT